MIGPRPEVQVQVDTATRRLQILGARPMNLRLPLTQIKNLMVADHVKNFETGGSLFGGWPALSPETKGSGQPLVRTGAIQRDLARKSGPGKSVRKWEVRVGIATSAGQRGDVEAYGDRDVFYGRFHQAGASGARRGDMPKREIVGITDKTQNQAVEIIRRYILSTGGRIPEYR